MDLILEHWTAVPAVFATIGLWKVLIRLDGAGDTDPDLVGCGWAGHNGPPPEPDMTNVIRFETKRAA